MSPPPSTPWACGRTSSAASTHTVGRGSGAGKAPELRQYDGGKYFNDADFTTYLTLCYGYAVVKHLSCKRTNVYINE